MIIEKHTLSEECELVSSNERSMEMHHGRMHNGNLECGLCNFVAKDSDKLHLHLVACKWEFVNTKQRIYLN